MKFQQRSTSPLAFLERGGITEISETETRRERLLGEDSSGRSGENYIYRRFSHDGRGLIIKLASPRGRLIATVNYSDVITVIKVRPESGGSGEKKEREETRSRGEGIISMESVCFRDTVKNRVALGARIRIDDSYRVHVEPRDFLGEFSVECRDSPRAVFATRRTESVAPDRQTNRRDAQLPLDDREKDRRYRRAVDDKRRA